MHRFWRSLTSEDQLRWLGPEKGVIHLATGAIVNAVWDLWAKHEGKPVWRLLAELEPEQIVDAIDFRYIDDALTPEEALEMLAGSAPAATSASPSSSAAAIPAYTTSAGWLGYTDEKIVSSCSEALAAGFTHVKMKVGQRSSRPMRGAPA